MKIAITTVQVPFIHGGAELLADNLKNALIRSGHEAEIISMPYVEKPLCRIENHIAAARLLDLGYAWAGKIDLCIGLKFPAYFIPHPNKVIWMLHQHRPAYDQYYTELSDMRMTPEGVRMREIIRSADNLYLKEAKRIYTIAGNVSKRLERYNQISSTPLYHPCPDMDKFYCGDYGDYILMPSRINTSKRQILALEALCRTKEKVKLCLVGKADNAGEEERVRSFIEEHGLRDRVHCFGFVSQEEKLKLYANARAVLFIPKDEDYGYITLEAMAAGKAVITAVDSGGPLEFVIDGETGITAGPTPDELAQAMDSIMTSKTLAENMGKKARLHLDEMEITWEKVVKELTKI